jgi:AcrR family transcriptional regulator
MSKLLSFQERRATLTPKSQKRVEAVLTTARQVFSEFGYEKSTTLEIAQRLGISEATVFTYFGSKRELCMQVISDWYDEISLELEKEVPLIHGTRARLGYIVYKHLNTLIRDGKGLCALVLSEGRSPDTGFAKLLADLQRRYTAPLMGVLSAAQACGEIRTDMPLRLMRDMVYG